MRVTLILITAICILFAVGYRNNATNAESHAFIGCSEDGMTGVPLVACMNYNQTIVDHDHHVSDWLWSIAIISGFTALAANRRPFVKPKSDKTNGGS